MKVQVNLKVVQAGVIETFDNGTRLQIIKAFEPGYTDEFGEKKGKDQFHEIKVFNGAIDKLPNELQEPFKGTIKAKLNLYVTSSEFEYEGRQIAKTELVLAKMEVIE